MDFNTPAVLWLLLLVPVFGLIRYRQEGRSGVIFPPLQLGAGPTVRKTIWGRLLVPLELLFVTIAIIALAGPSRSDRLQSLSESGLDLALVLDVSASMQAADFPPNRLEALKKLASELLLKGGPNRIALYAFAGHTFTQTPLTTDRSSLLAMVDSLAFESINHGRSGGTALGDALLVAGDTLVKNRHVGRDQVLVLITDGESNLGSDPMLAARFIRSEGLRLLVIGVGGDEPVRVYVHGEPFINSDDEHLETSLDDRQLIEIAETAGGQYRRARDLSVLEEIFDELGRLQKTPIESSQLVHRKALTPLLGGLLFLLAAVWLWIEAVVLRRPLR